MSNKNTKLKIGDYDIVLDSLGAWHVQSTKITFYFKYGGCVIVPITKQTTMNNVLNFLENQFNTFLLD